MKDFLSLTQKECAKVYPQIIENGNRHISSAKLLGKHKEYPHAIAHLILGAEELIKGIFLALENNGIIYKQLKNYKNLYFDHKTRHNILKDFYTYLIPLRTLIKIFNSKKQGSPLQKFFLYSADALSGLILTTSNKSWWDKADALKQRCLYVDFKDVAIIPSELGSYDYEQALNHVSSLQQDVKGFIEFIESLDQTTLDDFKKTLNSQEANVVLQKVLEKKKSK